MSTPPSSAMTPEPDMQEFALRTRKSPGHAWLALAIVAAVFLVLTSAWRQGWFTPTSHVYIEVAGASGIQAGTQVRLKGFKIGEVDDIKLEKNLSVRVRLRIETEKMELLGANASAKFGRDSPIAGKFIELLPGAREGQRLAGGQTLPVDAGNETRRRDGNRQGGRRQALDSTWQDRPHSGRHPQADQRGGIHAPDTE